MGTRYVESWSKTQAIMVLSSAESVLFVAVGATIECL